MSWRLWPDIPSLATLLPGPTTDKLPCGSTAPLGPDETGPGPWSPGAAALPFLPSQAGAVVGLGTRCQGHYSALGCLLGFFICQLLRLGRAAGACGLHFQASPSIYL